MLSHVINVQHVLGIQSWDFTYDCTFEHVCCISRSYSNLREVIVPRSVKGYGFAMRGVKGT